MAVGYKKPTECYFVKDLLSYVGDLNIVNSLLQTPKRKFLKDWKPIRKISSFPDGLGKSRYIALGD